MSGYTVVSGNRGAGARPVGAALLCCMLLAGCAASAPSEQSSAQLRSRLDEILHQRDRGEVHFGARVIDLDSGKELYASAPDEPLMPASNLKLPVSATFIDTFGPNHTFKTWLALDGDDLWLIGTGDPGTGDPTIARKYGQLPTTMLNEWSAALRRRGISEIRGNLYYFDGAFEEQWTHPSWSRSFATDWYAAPVTGLNFNDNCVDITVFPSAAGKPASFTVMPPAPNEIRVVNECLTAAGGATTAPTIERQRDANVYTLGGATTRPAELKSKPVTDPGAFFADALRTSLESHGIKVLGKTLRAEKPLDGKPIPPADKIVAVHESKMRDLLSRINKNSQNLFAEAASKLSGQQYLIDQGRGWHPGSWESGSQAVAAFLLRQGISTQGLVVTDGSGLSRNNRVTARLITDLLAAMNRHPYGTAWRSSLSVAGQDGTLAKRMTDLRGHVFGKTGYIGGVRACSGYVKTRAGRWLAFSIIYNGIEGSVSPYEALQDEAIRLLVNFPNIESSPATRPSTRGSEPVAASH